jgi:hypothetical protein
MRAIILALLLLWLCFTGGYAGWNSGLLWVNLALWGLLLAWMIGQSGRVKVGLESSLFIYMLAVLGSAVITGSLAGGLGRAAIWFAYLGFYLLADQWSDEEIHRAAALALPVYGLAAFFPWENPNVIAFHLLGLILLTVPALDWKLTSPFYLLLAWPLNSVGGLLAGFVAAAPYALRFTFFAAAPLALLGWWFNPSGYAYRLQFWAEAWKDFLLFPIWGIGPGNYHVAGWWHAHNIIASAAAETGLLGLAALGLLIWAIALRTVTLPAWAASIVLAYGVWSLVDEPLQFWGAGFILFLALSRGKEKDNDLVTTKTQLEV